MADPFDPDAFMAQRKQAQPQASGFDPDAFMAGKDGTPKPMPPAASFGSLVPEPVKRFGSNFLSAVNPLPGLAKIASEAADPQIGLTQAFNRNILDPQYEQARQAGEAFRGEGEATGMGLPSRLSLAVGHGLAAALPILGPAAANAGEQIGEGDVAGGLGSGAGLLASTVAAPRLMGATGRGLMRTVEPIAENASGIAFRDRAFGRNGEDGGMTPGRFALDYTKGVRPGTVARQAQESLRDINTNLEGVVGRSTADTHLTPARNVVNGAINTAGERNSSLTPARMTPMQEYLEGKPVPLFKGATEFPQGAHTPITIHPPATTAYGAGTPQITRGVSPEPVVAETQTPKDLLGMKRQFNEDFVRNYNPTVDTKGQLGVARQTAHALGSELHRAVPESVALDRAASAGIPIAEESELKALRAGPVQNALNRFGAHTGALTGMIAGGATHGLPGAALGLAIPEIVANPTVQMTAARGLDLAGKGLRSPVGSRVAAAPLLVRPKQQPTLAPQ
jgi:hypothetical protein